MGDPMVSVIMPVRNEAQHIARSLTAVLRQDYPADRLEILIADGESKDGTVAIIQSLIQAPPDAERVQVVRNPARIQAAGMNEALRLARGDVIVRVDGHTIIAPDYVRQCVRALDQTGAHAVGGSLAPLGFTTQAKAIAAACTCAFAVPTAFHLQQTAGRFTDTVYMGAWPRWVLERAGGFDERLPINEDYELHYRLRQAAGTVYLSPAIRSLYVGRQTLGALARQYFHYGRGKISTLRKAPRALRPRQLVAPAFVGFIGGGLLLVPVSPSILALWLAVALSYLAVNLAFSVRTAQRAGLHLLRWLPLAFTTMHLAWGIGFWYGLISEGMPGQRVAGAQQETGGRRGDERDGKPDLVVSPTRFTDPR